MTTNEQIIIDGKVKNCKILFECNSVDDLASFIMMRAGVEITPDNAPVFHNFDIRLIAEPRSPYGFSSLFKRNENIDEWEYMGFGHSGACSVVTALLKQLQRKTAECEELKEEKEKGLKYVWSCFDSACKSRDEWELEYDKSRKENKKLKHKLQIATKVLKFVHNEYYTHEAQQALEQIESEAQ